jgi:hypothetical protein
VFLQYVSEVGNTDIQSRHATRFEAIIAAANIHGTAKKTFYTKVFFGYNNGMEMTRHLNVKNVKGTVSTCLTREPLIILRSKTTICGDNKPSTPTYTAFFAPVAQWTEHLPSAPVV